MANSNDTICCGRELDYYAKNINWDSLYKYQNLASEYIYNGDECVLLFSFIYENQLFSYIYNSKLHKTYLSIGRSRDLIVIDSLSTNYFTGNVKYIHNYNNEIWFSNIDYNSQSLVKLVDHDFTIYYIKKKE